MQIIVVPLSYINELEIQQPYSIISIREPCDGKAKIEKKANLRSILSLEFMDLDLTTRPKKHWNQPYTTGGAPLFSYAMHEAHADQIARFCRQNSEPVLVVHCRAGASRSPSTAMAIADSLGVPRLSIDWIGDVLGNPPNQHVYNMVMAAFVRFPEHWEPQQERQKYSMNGSIA